MSSMRMHLVRRKKAVAVSFLVLAAGMVALYAQDKSPGKEPPNQPVKNKVASPSGGGLKAFIDPETGKLREGDASEMQALQAQGTAAFEPRQVSLRQGGVGIRVGESQMVYSVARIGPYGKLTTSCVTGKQQAEAILRVPVTREAPDVK